MDAHAAYGARVGRGCSRLAVGVLDRQAPRSAVGRDLQQVVHTGPASRQPSATPIDGVTPSVTVRVGENARRAACAVSSEAAAAVA
jgi:hypothetical protein